MKKRVSHIAVPIGAIAQTDLQIGMYLTNDGTTPIPLYNSVDGTGTPVLQIQPGQVIGQIIDFGNGPGGTGYVVGFTSQQITDAQSGWDAVDWFLIGWTGVVAPCATANFSDLQNNVSPTDIATQAAAIQQANKAGVSFVNDLTKVAQGAANVVKAIGEPFMWIGLALLAAWVAVEETKK